MVFPDTRGVKTEVTVKSKEIEEYKGKLVVSPFTYSYLPT